MEENYINWKIKIIYGTIWWMFLFENNKFILILIFLINFFKLNFQLINNFMKLFLFLFSMINTSEIGYTMTIKENNNKLSIDITKGMFEKFVINHELENDKKEDEIIEV